MREKTLGALLGLGAALGFGCAEKPKEEPAYDPPREAVFEAPDGSTLYKDVWSDAETLMLRLYTENADGAPGVFDATWIRREAKNSGACLSKELNATLRVDLPMYGAQGKAVGTAADNGCDDTLDSCNAVFIHDADGRVEDHSEEACAGQTFSSLEAGMSGSLLDTEEETRLWHERKRVE